MRILDFNDGFESNVEPTQVPFPANNVSVAPSGNLESTDAQAALNELQTDIDTINDSVGVADGIATLDSNGKLPTSQLPNLSITEVYVVADITERDALTVQEGDVAKVLDDGSGNIATYINDGSSWVELNNDGALATHEADTSTHGVTGNIVGDSDTQELSNKTFTDAPTFDEQVSTPSTPASGKAKIYPKDNGKWYTLNDAGSEQEIGSGASSGDGNGINYSSNPDFESGVTDVTSTANITVSEETVNPIRGTKSLKLTIGTSATTADYADIPLTTFENADTDIAKLMRCAFEYYNDVNMSSDDLQVVLRDNTNNVDITAVGKELGKIKYSESIRPFVALIPTTKDISDYSLRVRVLSAPSTASNLVIDTVQVGPDIKTAVEGEVVNSIYRFDNDGRSVTAFTESIPFTSGSGGDGWVAGADGSSGTTGNYYEVQEDDAIVTVSTSIRFTTSSAAYVYLQKNGSNVHLLSASDAADIAYAGSYTSKKGEFQKGDKLAIVSSRGGTLNNDTATHYITITERKRISNVVSLSEAIDKSSMLVADGIPSSTINGSANDIVWPNIQQDEFKLYDNTTGEITIPRDGWYFVQAVNEQAATPTSVSNTYAIEVHNKTTGAVYSRQRENPFQTGSTTVMAPRIFALFKANKGDLITCRSTNNATSPSYVSSFEGQRLEFGSFHDLTTFGTFNEEGQLIAGFITKEPEPFTVEEFSVGFGTVTNDDFEVTRRGKFAHVKGKFTTGTVTGASATIELPASLTPKVKNQFIKGRWWDATDAAAQVKSGNVYIDQGAAPNIMWLAIDTDSTLGAPYSNIPVNDIVGNGATIEIDVTFEVADWEDSTLFDSTALLQKNATTYADTQVPTGTLSGSYNTVVFGTVSENAGTLYNTTTGQWTAPKDGFVLVNGSIWLTYTSATGITSRIRIANITQSKYVYGNNFNGGSSSGAQVDATGILEVSKGDILEIQSLTDGASPAFAPDGSSFSFAYMPDLTKFGEYTNRKTYTAEITSLTTLSSDNTWTDVTGSSITIPAGEYWFSYIVGGSTTGTETNGRFGNVGIFDDNNNLIGGITLNHYAENRGRTFSATVFGIVLSEETTVKLRARKTTGITDFLVGTGAYTSNLTDPDVSSIFQAQKVG